MTSPQASTSAKDKVWPECLASAQAIAEYVVGLSPYEVSEEQIEEQYFGCHAKLTWLDLSAVLLESGDHNLPCEDRQKSVDDLPVSAMPPLLVDQSVLQDGYHRFRKLMNEGVTHHWAYVIEVAPEDVLEFPGRKVSKLDEALGALPHSGSSQAKNDDLIKKYMTGSCHALAYVLSELLSKPVGVLQACREGQDPIPDPLHVFVILDDDLVLDVKGQRSRHSMENDFTGLMGLLKAHENDVLSMHHSKLSYASDLYEDLQFDPSHQKGISRSCQPPVGRTGL
jgi:hypothetical protein